MWFLSLLIIYAPFAVQGKSVGKNKTELEWPETYSFNATVTYVTSGVIEEFEVWQTPKRSRIDINGGAVITIVENSTSYKILPETNKENNITLVCKKTESDWNTDIDPESYLPSLEEDLEDVGTEELNGVECTKFYKKYEFINLRYEFILWAIYRSTDDIWVPIRYEKKNFNTWLGSLDNHEIWEFNNFEIDFVEDGYDVEEVCSDAEIYDVNHNEVTEHLLFLDPDNNAHVEHAFNAFKKKHNRKYAEKEHDLRKLIFSKNMRHITRMNRQKLGYKLAVNQFADRTEAEMNKHKGAALRPENDIAAIPFPYSESELDKIAESLPKEYDARLYGLVTPVKNQISCESAWTFSTTAAIEGALALSTDRLVTLSNQAILDCAWGYGGLGCEGGSDIAAFKWTIANGLPTEEEYGSYINSEGFCKINNMTKLFHIRGYTPVSAYSVNALKVALVNHGPLSVYVTLGPEFKLYSSGIYYDSMCDPTTLDHQVTLIGYGEDNGDPYWIVKNSWGRQWGLDGYMHISTRDNMCGVATKPSYVVV